MKKKMNFKQITALAGVIILAGLYIVSLILAVISNKHALTVLKISIFSTIVIPAWIYIFLMFYKLAHKNDQPEDMVFSEDEDDPFAEEDNSFTGEDGPFAGEDGSDGEESSSAEDDPDRQ